MVMKMKGFILIILLTIAYCLTGCNEPGSNSRTVAQSRYLYVASGACYSGNNTTFTNLTSSNQIYRLNINNGSKESIIADYWSAPSNSGDSPVSIQSIDDNNLYVLLENTTTTSLRRVEKLFKSPFSVRNTFSSNVTALSAQLRDLSLNSAGGLLISKSSAVEYITSANARIGTPFISASLAPCNTSTTLITRTIPLSNGKYIFLHAATGQNRIGTFNSAGGTTCLSAQAAPSAASYPTAAIYDSANTRLIVAYAGNALTADLNSIYTYTLNESTGAFSSPQKIYDANLYPSTYSYLLYGISEMAFDPIESAIYISTANGTTTTISNYIIEKFIYDPTQVGVDNTKVLTKNNSSFYTYGNDTRCISKMLVSN